MALFTLYFSCESWLAQWFISDSGGGQPIKLRKNSPESKFLYSAIRRKFDTDPDPPKEGNFVVYIPEYRGKNPFYNHYLPEAKRKVFLRIIKDRFDVQLWIDLAIVTTTTTKDAIMDWMTSHGIEVTDKNYNAIAKRLQRMRKNFYRAQPIKKVIDLKTK